MKQLILFISTALFLTSCGKHSDGTSVWAEGLWILPLLPLAGAVIFGYRAWVASKSNSTQQMSDKSIKDNTGNVSIFKTGYFKLFVACLVALAIILVWVNMEK